MNYIERKEDYLKGRIIPQTANDDFVELKQWVMDDETGYPKLNIINNKT